MVEAVEQLFSCCVPTEESAGKKKPITADGGAALGRDLQLPGVRHLGQRQVHPVQRRGHCRSGRWSAWRMEEMPGEPFRQNPTSGSARRTPGAPDGGRRHPGLGRVRRVRRPDAVAGAGRVQRHRRPAAGPHRHHPAAARRRRSWRWPDEHLERLPGGDRRDSRCPPTSRPCSPRRTSTTASGCPTCSRCGSATPTRIVLSKTNAKVGAKVKISVMTATAPDAGAADRGRDHRAWRPSSTPAAPSP